MHLTLFIIGLLVVGLILLIFQYQELLRSKKKVEENWRNVDLKLNERYEVIPAIVKIVQASTKRETAVFEKIASARTQAVTAANFTDQAAAESFLSQSLKSLFAISEEYPDLKNKETFRDLQQTLSDVEDAIHLAKKEYNKTVKENNRKVARFPGMLIAGPLGFGTFDFFEI